MSLVSRILQRMRNVGRVAREVSRLPGARQYGSALLDVPDANLTPVERLRRAYPGLEFIEDNNVSLSPANSYSDILRVIEKPKGPNQGVTPQASLYPLTRRRAMNSIGIPRTVVANNTTVRPFEDEFFPRDYLDRYAGSNNVFSRPAAGTDDDLFAEIDAMRVPRGGGAGSHIYPALFEYAKMRGLPVVSTALTASNIRRRPINMISANIRGLGFADVLPYGRGHRMTELPMTQRWAKSLDPDEQLGILMADESANVLKAYTNPFGYLGLLNLSDFSDPNMGRMFVNNAQSLFEESTPAAKALIDQGSGYNRFYSPASLRRAALVKATSDELSRGRPVEDILDEVREFPRESVEKMFKKYGGYVRKPTARPGKRR